MTQAQALAIMKTGVNVYLTGSAGSGKTHTLREYIKWLDEHGIPVAVTASTGIAATHMNGQTIHGWAGIGIREHIDDFALEQLEQNQYLWKRFEKARVLIIDEVSMLHAFQLDMINQLCKSFKGNSLPFGGLQVILCGDFFQLPPVMSGQDSNSNKRFAFASKAWKELNLAICYLHTQHRQDEGDFTVVLNELRK